MNTQEKLRERAALRYAADFDMPRARALDDIERTFIGRQYLLREAMRDVVEAVRRAAEGAEGAAASLRRFTAVWLRDR